MTMLRAISFLAIANLAIQALTIASAPACAPPQQSHKAATSLTVTTQYCGPRYDCLSPHQRHWIASSDDTIPAGRWRIQRWQSPDSSGTIITRTTRSPARIADAADRAAQINLRWWPSKEPGHGLTIIDGVELPDPHAAANADGVILLGLQWSHPAEREWLTAHEVAHQWWRGHQMTTDEGMAELTARLATARRTPPTLRLTCDAGAHTPQCVTHIAAQAAAAARNHDPLAFDRHVSRWVTKHKNHNPHTNPWPSTPRSTEPGGKP